MALFRGVVEQRPGVQIVNELPGEVRLTEKDLEDVPVAPSGRELDGAVAVGVGDVEQLEEDRVQVFLVLLGLSRNKSKRAS